MDLIPASFSCPDPLSRAPLATHDAHRPRSRLHVAPSGLQGAIAAILWRDTRGSNLSDAQRLTHLPASPMVSLAWFQDVDAGRIEQTETGPKWRPLRSPIVLSGSHSNPSVCWAPAGGRTGMICFHAGAAQALFKIDLSAIQDVTVDARDLLDDSWHALFESILAADSDAASLAAIERHILPRWRSSGHSGSAFASLCGAGRQWVKRLTWLAYDWRRSNSARHVERRIKAYSGRSLREWQSLVKTEGLFFNARGKFEAGGSLDWAAIAYEEGFADQAHLSRAVKRITGFSPCEFARRFAEDESFWVYRVWV
ncbi:AraC family transcriptional regulator [Achromobacter insolitus]|nr:AraC family transcriptional regulator [Achromobacter insolitus]